MSRQVRAEQRKQASRSSSTETKHAAEGEVEKLKETTIKEMAESSTQDEKSNRKKAKRQNFKLKKREAKEKEQGQHRSTTPERTFAEEAPASRGPPTSPFTFSSGLNPPTLSFASSQGQLFSHESASIFEISAEQARPEANACAKNSSIQDKITNDLLTVRRSPFIYCQDQGEPFATQISPFSSYESLALSVDPVQTTPLMERYPVAGRVGALSAPSTPVYSQDGFWETETTVGSPPPNMYDHDDKKMPTQWIRRASSMDFEVLDWNEDWALDSLTKQRNIYKEADDVVTSPTRLEEKPSLDPLCIDRTRLEWRETSPVIHSDTTEGGPSDFEGDIAAKGTIQEIVKTTPAISSEEDDQAIVIQESEQNYLEIQLYEDDEDQDEVAFSKKTYNKLYTPYGDFQRDLHMMFNNGYLFFNKFGKYFGEVHNEEGQYSIVQISRIKDCIAEGCGELESTVWYYLRPHFGPMSMRMTIESLEDEERRIARAKSTLSPALQRTKERLQREAAEHGKPAAAGKTTRNRLAGGVKTKWAAIRRKNTIKAGEAPKKVIKEVEVI
jgi:hypothetical protein